MSMLSTSPIIDFVNDLFCGETIRVAVCGAERSGKTVFLTALASHLENHDLARDDEGGYRFDLGGGRSVANFHLLTGAHGGKNDPIGEFNYEEAKQSVIHNQWPKTTYKPTELAISFDVVYPEAKPWAIRRILRNDRKRHTVTLRLLDIPGERLADFSMADKSYANWSCSFLATNAGGVQDFLKWLNDLETKDRDNGDGNTSVKSSLFGKTAQTKHDDGTAKDTSEIELIKSASLFGKTAQTKHDDGTAKDTSEIELIKSALFEKYAECLDKAYLQQCRYLSPSTTRISRGGKIFPNKIDPKHPEEFSDELVNRLGVDPNHRFVPLTKYWLERMPEIAKEFSRHYEVYKEEIVSPLTNWMTRAHCALFLVDMFSALNGGAAAYENVKHETKAALQTLHQTGLGTYLLNGIVRQRVDRDRIRVVVTKTDRAEGEESRRAIVAQAIRMLGSVVQNVVVDIPKEDVFMSCAAIQTHSGGGKRTITISKSDPNFAELRGTMNEKGGPNPPSFYTPEESANNEGSNRPPRHSDLDVIARFILDLPEQV